MYIYLSLFIYYLIHQKDRVEPKGIHSLYKGASLEYIQKLQIQRQVQNTIRYQLAMVQYKTRSEDFNKQTFFSWNEWVNTGCKLMFPREWAFNVI